MFAVNPALMDILARLVPICNTPECLAYLVGGFVRDWLIGKDTNDLDIVVGGDSLVVAQEAAEAVNGRYVLLDEENGVGRVVVAGEESPLHIDFTSYKGNLEHNLLRRDFTVNAMAMEMGSFVSDNITLIDPTGGEADLKEGLLRQTSDSIFREDPSRLMRAVRLAKELNLDIEPLTEETIRLDCSLISKVPGEKTREELLKIMAMPFASNSLLYLGDLGMLCQIIPELKAMKGVTQPSEHYWDVYNHTIEAVASLEYLLRESDWAYGKKELQLLVPWSSELQGYFENEVGGGSNRKTLLKFAMLLHDIAKPKTRTVQNDGRIRFIGHSKEGAIMAVKIMERLRFSTREINYVETAVYHHLHPAQMSDVNGLPTRHAIYRYFRDTGGAGIDIIYLALADYLAAYGPRVDRQDWAKNVEMCKYIMEINDQLQREVVNVRLITGDDLINEFDLKPGKELGQLLDMVKEAQVSGQVKTREEALKLVKKEINRWCSI